jgi:hypothetical protein
MTTIRELREIPAYSVPEAAHYLNVPPSTLPAWCVGQRYRHHDEDRLFKPLITPAQKRPVSLSFSNLVEDLRKRCRKDGANLNERAAALCLFHRHIRQAVARPLKVRASASDDVACRYPHPPPLPPPAREHDLANGRLPPQTSCFRWHLSQLLTIL